MTPEAIAGCRQRLGLSLPDMAKALARVGYCVHPMTIWRWEQPVGSPQHHAPAQPEMLALALGLLERR